MAGHSSELTRPNADKDVETAGTLIHSGGNKEWYSHFGSHFGDFLQNDTVLPHSCASWYLPTGCKKLTSTEKPKHRCLDQLYSQL